MKGEPENMRRTTDRTAAQYKAIKEALKAERESVKHFTLEFYRTFLKCRQAAEENRKAGIDDSYTRPEEWFKRYHAWDAVYSSRFYNENSAAYCRFLELA